MARIELTEHQIQDQIIQLLGMKGYYVQRLNAGMISMGEGRSRRMVRMVKSGTPDIMAFKRWKPWADGLTGKSGWFMQLLFIEVKRPGKKPTPLQEAKMAELEEYGARCIVVHSVTEMEAVL